MRTIPQPVGNDQPTFSIEYLIGNCRITTPYAHQAHAEIAAQSVATSHGAVRMYQHTNQYSKMLVMIA